MSIASHSGKPTETHLSDDQLNYTKRELLFQFLLELVRVNFPEIFLIRKKVEYVKREMLFKLSGDKSFQNSGHNLHAYKQSDSDSLSIYYIGN